MPQALLLTALGFVRRAPSARGTLAAARLATTMSMLKRVRVCFGFDFDREAKEAGIMAGREGENKGPIDQTDM